MNVVTGVYRLHVDGVLTKPCMYVPIQLIPLLQILWYFFFFWLTFWYFSLLGMSFTNLFRSLPGASVGTAFVITCWAMLAGYLIPWPVRCWNKPLLVSLHQSCWNSCQKT